MARNVVFAATLLLSALSSVTLVTAQQNALAELYGRGVHAYFAGDYGRAHEFLTEAIDEGVQDPRVYFFRGLTYSMSGRPDEAKADFQNGAALEANSTERVYDVSRALQRVQGEIRLEIEEYRHDARVKARELAAKRARARYQQFQESQEQAATKRAPRRRAPTPAEPPEVNDPFAGGEPTTVDPSTGGGTEGTTPDDPFSSGTPTDTAPTDDPFGGSTEEPDATEESETTEESTTTEEPAPSDGPAGATVDPFGPPPGEPDDEPAAGTPGANAAEPNANAGAAAGGGKRKGVFGGLFRAFRGSAEGMVPDLSQLPIPIPGQGGGAPGAPPVVEEPPADPFGAVPGDATEEEAPSDEVPSDEAPSDEAPAPDPFGDQ